uniref:Mammalian defensins domain-containing protein n=1 Tax=Loxodonta africana TaxID=9785 RepID=G3TLR6_LOXAF
MKTLALLAAILLLALQAQAEPLRQTADKVQAQDKPGAEDLDVVVSFTGEEHSIQEASGVRSNLTCYCRFGLCLFPERRYGICIRNGIRLAFCCR